MSVSRVEATCKKSQEIFASCEGSFIHAMSFGAAGGRDYLSIVLIQTQKWEEVTILLEAIRYFKVDKSPDLEGSFVDEISASYLPKADQSWPDEAKGLVTRFDGLPELYWVQVVGPASLSVVAQIMTVSVSQDLPKN